MSITATMTTVVHPTKSTQKPPQLWRHRIRKGQKLDEVLHITENRQTEAQSSTSVSPPASAPESSTKQSTNATSSTTGGDSPFQLQEYLAMLVRRNPHDVDRIVALPPESEIESATSISSPPMDKGKGRSESEEEGILQPVDTDVWVYEQLRRIVLDLTTPWLTALQQECDKHARPQTCAAMNAGDWMFLCASHGEEKQCCAIDYMVHTLDGATSLLNSARHFPSRTYVPNTSLRHFGSIARRLSRIFVHAWCYHKDVFEACEAETSLYSRFYALVETYDLTATDNLPPRSRNGVSAADDIHSQEKDEFSRGPVLSAKNTDTTARRERSGTGGPRTSIVHGLQAPEEDDLGLVPPPAPSPRPTAILSRPDHEEEDEPAWTTNTNHGDDDEQEANASQAADESRKDEEEDDLDEETDDKGAEDDAEATISLKGKLSGGEQRDSAASTNTTIHTGGEKAEEVKEGPSSATEPAVEGTSSLEAASVGDDATPAPGDGLKKESQKEES